MNLDEYLPMFLEECRENLGLLDSLLLDLERDHDLIHVRDVFRIVHTVKGMSSTMGFDDLAHVTHMLEAILDRARTEQIPITGELVDVIFAYKDVFEEKLDDIEKDTNTVDLQAFEQKLVVYNDMLSTGRIGTLAPAGGAKAAPARASQPVTDGSDPSSYPEETRDAINDFLDRNYNAFHVQVSFLEECEVKNVRAFMVLKKLQDHGVMLYSKPDVKQLQDMESMDGDFELVLATLTTDEEIRGLISSVSEVSKVSIKPIAVQDYEQKDLPTPATINDQVKNEINKKLKAVRNVRVSIEQLDTLMNLTGELLINKIRLDKIAKQYENKEFNDALEQLNILTFELQDQVMQMRMIPVSHIFNRFPRMIRDIAKETHKQVDFVMEGSEIELDRTILDKISDPLVHILRNAVDHGLESTEARIAVGKPAQGTVTLTTRRLRNKVIIEVLDDGGGIDWEQVKRAAIKKGAISTEDAEKMGEKQLKNRLLEGGISTSSEVTMISGRGVGLSAVKSIIDELGGHVEISTELGKWTKFSLELPLTIAIIPCLMVELHHPGNEYKEIYAIPINNVFRILKVKRTEIKTIKKKQVINFFGEIIPLLGLSDLLAFRKDGVENPETINIVLVEKMDKAFGLIVDELVGQQEVVIKNLGQLLRGTAGIAGGTILGDGKVALILDINTLF